MGGEFLGFAAAGLFQGILELAPAAAAHFQGQFHQAGGGAVPSAAYQGHLVVLPAVKEPGDGGQEGPGHDPFPPHGPQAFQGQAQGQEAGQEQGIHDPAAALDQVEQKVHG